MHEEPALHGELDDADYTDYFAGAMPTDPVERAKLQALAPHIALPAPVPDSRDMPCAGCGLMLSVGPRLQDKMRDDPRVKLTCVYCMAKRGGTVRVQSLDNPNSRPESAWDTP